MWYEFVVWQAVGYSNPSLEARRHELPDEAVPAQLMQEALFFWVYCRCMQTLSCKEVDPRTSLGGLASCRDKVYAVRLLSWYSIVNTV